MLLVWQSVVWANPDAFHQQDLQPRMVFDPAEHGKDALLPITGMFIKYRLLRRSSPKPLALGNELIK
jgi:hypothetical protein